MRVPSIIALSATFLLAGCGAAEPGPVTLADPCALISDAMLDRLAPGAVREPTGDTAAVTRGTRACEVDLTGGTAYRGDLLVRLSYEPDGFGPQRRAGICADLGATMAAGETSCLVVRPWDGAESRIDGYAWLGDGREAQVGYQLVDPPELPPAAEADLRDLLAAATAALPPVTG